MYGSRPTTRFLSIVEWVARLLAGLDSPFIVRRPAELRKLLERHAGEITALAKRTDGQASL